MGLVFAISKLPSPGSVAKRGELVRERQYVGYLFLPRYVFAAIYEIYQTNICRGLFLSHRDNFAARPIRCRCSLQHHDSAQPTCRRNPLNGHRVSETWHGPCPLFPVRSLTRESPLRARDRTGGLSDHSVGSRPAARRLVADADPDLETASPPILPTREPDLATHSRRRSLDNGESEPRPGAILSGTTVEAFEHA